MVTRRDTGQETFAGSWTCATSYSEDDFRRNLAEPRIAAVELIEAPEKRVAGNQVVAAVDLLAAGHIAEVAAGVLRMVHHIKELAGHLEANALGDIETLHQRDVDV